MNTGKLILHDIIGWKQKSWRTLLRSLRCLLWREKKVRTWCRETLPPWPQQIRPRCETCGFQQWDNQRTEGSHLDQIFWCSSREAAVDLQERGSASPALNTRPLRASRWSHRLLQSRDNQIPFCAIVFWRTCEDRRCWLPYSSDAVIPQGHITVSFCVQSVERLVSSAVNMRLLIWSVESVTVSVCPVQQETGRVYRLVMIFLYFCHIPGCCIKLQDFSPNFSFSLFLK